jgi:hypothetical protein
MAQRSGAGELAALATDVVTLEELDRTVVQRVLDDLGPRLDPPLSSDETAAYVDGVRSPDTLDSLVRVLSLAAGTQAAT